ncbi:hypothetical protein EDB80DRAFT_864865 [Ilyonectria destructans]|nr:hypothetical protein EDB80DRAFT_864865 [Ilyonectria destructans]
MPGSLNSPADVDGPANSNSASQRDDANLPKERRESRIRKQPRGAQRPTSLNLSESEFPMVTQDPMRISAHDASQYKARRRGPQISPALSSSVPSTAPNDVFSERQAESRTDLSWSPEFPEYAIASQPPSQILPAFDPQFGGQYPLPQSYPIHNYGAPETPRGNGPFPYFQPPHFPNPMVGPNPMTAPNPMLPQPRAERPPLSGYDLLAAKLTDDVGGGAPITAMYRRFECINHRVLLSLQDQITVLEENLLEMDEIDSGNRLQAGIPLPASEREERVSNHDFHLNKMRLLSQLAQKLQVYNTLLASFKDIQNLPPPTQNEIRDYRAFLDEKRPIAESETGFIDETDLVLLEPRPPVAKRAPDDQVPRPVRGPGHGPNRLATAHRHLFDRGPLFHRGPLQEVAIGAVTAIFGPLLAFPVIHDFAGRMTIVILFGAIVCMVLFSTGAFNLAAATTHDAQEYLIYGGVYVGGMTVLARFLQ